MQMIQLPEPAAQIIEKLNECGFEAYAVGGCVRDSLLGRTPEDWDITTSAKPEQVKGIFGRTVDTGIQHGTVTVMVNRIGYEVTTYRIDGEYEDGRHPKSVEFTPNLLEDLRRRDFTINAMAYSDRDQVVDAFDGMTDLNQKVIRCVGAAADRFDEDALRILRAIRFSAQLGFTIDEKTLEAISIMAPNLTNVSKERICTELTKLLMSEHPEKIKLVFEMAINPYISEHFKRIVQLTDKELENINSLPVKKHMRWAGFLREESGADALAVLREMKLDNDTIEKSKTLVSRWKQEIKAEPIAIRRVMCGLPSELYDDLLCFQETFCEDIYRKQLKQIREYTKQIREKQDCVRLKDMAVKGSDLIAAGIKPGPQIGKVLDDMLQIVLERPECNTKEYLMKADGFFQ